MSFESAPYYWIVCDQPDCGAKSTEFGEFTAWSDKDGAEEEAFNSDWTIAQDGKHYCEKHHPEEDEDGQT